MKDEAPLTLHIPEARFRPGDKPDFNYLHLPEAGEAKRPKLDAQKRELRFENLKYTVETQALLAKSASALLEPKRRFSASAYR